MRQLIFFAFVGTLLVTDTVTYTSKVHRYPSNLEWLFNRNALSGNGETKQAVCESKECKKTAETMLSNMNKSVNPCDDFYEYACGKWPINNPLPQGMSTWNVLGVFQVKAAIQVKEILETESTDNEIKAVKLAKEWYKICTDTDTIEKQGLEPLISTLSDVGGWPMIMEMNKWNEQESNWQKVDDLYMRLTGRNAFYDVRIKNEDSNVVEIDTPHLPPGAIDLFENEKKDKKEDEEEKEKNKSDEDPSNEEKQSEEELENKNKDDSIIIIIDEDNDDECNDDCDDIDIGSSGSGDSDDCNDNCDDADVGSGNSTYDDDDDDDDDEDNMRKRERNVRQKISKKKVTGKFDHEKNKKVRHIKQSKSDIQTIKQNDKKEKQRLKRMTVPKVDGKAAQRLNHREKSHARKREKNHVEKFHTKRMKKILEQMETTTLTSNNNSDEDNEEDTLLQQYAKYIYDVACIIAKKNGIKVSQEHLIKDIQEMIEFQINLTKIIPDSDSSEPLNLTITLKGFQDWYNRKDLKTANSKIDWVYKIKALFDEANKSVDDNLSLNIISPKYIKDLISLLDKTSNRIIVNYIHWNFISKVLKATTEEMRVLSNLWEQASMNAPLSSRFFYCLKSPEIKDILAYEFVRKYFSEDTLEAATNIISAIQKEVEYLIKQSSWMDSKAKNFALAKIKYIKKFIGYPKWYENITMIQDYYDGFVISPLHYENVVRFNNYTKLKSLRTISRNESDIEKKHLNPTHVTALFSYVNNAMLLPAADFQSPWFSFGRPRSVNFGSMGFVMAHEINHGFDNSGHKYDKNGEFLGSLSAMAKLYDKKEKCFVKQFNNYPIIKGTNETIKNYGKQTTSDNIADTMGLQAIFKAYERNEKESVIPDTTLPGMEDFSNNQLFFLSFANLWCETFDPNRIVEYAKTDEHSIGRLRIIGSLANSDDFARAFNCPVNSPMNPKQKCNIWK